MATELRHAWQECANGRQLAARAVARGEKVGRTCPIRLGWRRSPAAGTEVAAGQACWCCLFRKPFGPSLFRATIVRRPHLAQWPTPPPPPCAPLPFPSFSSGSSITSGKPTSPGLRSSAAHGDPAASRRCISRRTCTLACTSTTATSAGSASSCRRSRPGRSWDGTRPTCGLRSAPSASSQSALPAHDVAGGRLD